MLSRILIYIARGQIPAIKEKEKYENGNILRSS